MTVRVSLLTALAAVLAIAQPKNADMCTPPPARVAPSLPAKLLSGQGTVHFPITTNSAEAQAFFDQGVAQMHSFWAVEAERSFLQAAALDPEAPMPHWGIAMVANGDYRPRFQLERDAEIRAPRTEVNPRVLEAVKHAQELAAVPGKASDLEKMYIAAIAVRRDVNAEDPDRAYIDALRAIASKYPDEVEAKSYLALHLMRGFILPQKAPRAGSGEAVDILRELLVKAPDHPGVHHYVIHGWEGSSFAAEAWPSCRKYPELAPNIPHALHMPGHIYAQTGKWAEAVKTFSDAAANERKWMAADSLYPNQHYGHNMHYLAAAASFLGDSATAMDAAKELLAIRENPREKAQVDNFYTAHRQGWFAMLRTLAQGERWAEILDGDTLPVYRAPRQLAWRAWAKGLAHLAMNDLASAQADAAAMEAALVEFKQATRRAKVSEDLAVAREELHGHLAIASGKVDKGFALLHEAVKRERAMRYTEPPPYPRPVLEALGEAALRQGRTAEARAAFAEALEQYPMSSRAVSGLRVLATQATK